VIKNILFLCVGNICRSPMAEGLLAHSAPHLSICSAGINALTGEPADPAAIVLMAARGIDISSHRAQPLAGWMLQDADLILTMDLLQERYIRSRYGIPAAKVRRLGLLGSKGGYDIPDPYRKGMPAFQHACSLITRGVEELSVQLAQSDHANGGIQAPSDPSPQEILPERELTALLSLTHQP